jgi:hypothetical protein
MMTGVPSQFVPAEECFLGRADAVASPRTKKAMAIIAALDSVRTPAT